MEYGDITVEMISEKEKEDWTMREFKMTLVIGVGGREGVREGWYSNVMLVFIQNGVLPFIVLFSLMYIPVVAFLL